LRRSEGYLAEAQKLTRTGSWAWNLAARHSLYWSQNITCIRLRSERGDTADEAFTSACIQEDRDRVRREGFVERPDKGSDLTWITEVVFQTERLSTFARGFIRFSRFGRHCGILWYSCGCDPAARSTKAALRRSEGYLAEAQRAGSYRELGVECAYPALSSGRKDLSHL